MPRQAHWLTRLPDAIRNLEHLERNVLLRRDLEALLGVSKVRATQLMHALGGRAFGNRLQLERTVLLEQLRRLRKSPGARLETARQVNLYTALQQARTSAVKIRVPRETLALRLAGLPPQVSVRRGEIVVQFSTAHEALQRLFELAQALANDFERFEKVCALPNNQA